MYFNYSLKDTLEILENLAFASIQTVFVCVFLQIHQIQILICFQVGNITQDF